MIPGRMYKGTSRIFSQPVKFAPNCPCFKLLAANTGCTIDWSVHQNHTPIIGYPKMMGSHGKSASLFGRNKFQ